ncbi:YheC/YheD family endospore coat-associated protein [Neobacillus drentensis]|uniref:YheC/YheD family endospore coat-associated protein n=1 Tax=Neobacillus drentensis TaxID=220684 RepID=UPI002FFDA09A
MDETSIGIILPKRQWKELAQEQLDEDYSFVFQYAETGERLNLEVLFFNIDEILVTERKGEALIIHEGEIVLKGFVTIPSIVYNPFIYHQKKHNRTIFELARQTDSTIINEQNNIKKTPFLDLMESYPKIKDQVKIADSNQPLFSLYVLGQKDCHHQWTTPLAYAKIHNAIYSLEEACQLVTKSQQVEEGIIDELYEISHQILEILHYYYPAIYEIGLEFAMTETTQIKIHSTCPVINMIRDISSRNQNLAKTILEWPIKLGKDISRIKNMEIPESSIPPQEENDYLDDTVAGFIGQLSLLDENVWVKFKVFHDPELKMKLPNRITERWRDQPEAVLFGVIEQPCHFDIYEDAIPLRHNSYNNPVDLFVSDSLVDKMHLPLDLVYQIQFTDRKAIIGPTIGLLLGEKNQVTTLKYMEKFKDRFGEYHRFGGVTIAFSARSVDWEEKIVYGMIYDHDKKHWRYQSTPIPAAIYRRNFHQKKESIKKLKELTNNNLFNSYHFKKSDLYLLKDNPELKNNLPETFLLKNIAELIDFLQVNKKIILKPVSSSRGRGIFILEVNSEHEGFCLYDYRNNTKITHRIKDINELETLLVEEGIFNQEYLYQTYIPLLKVGNRSLDVRVVMQKYNKMKWQCTGIECRVAQEDVDLTNIARGGDAMTLEAVIKNAKGSLNYSQVYRNILNICQIFCRIMDQKNEHFAEFGIDIALDDEGFPWILEANIYPSFKGFKTLDYETYLKIRNQPLFYAVQIQGFQILDEEAFGQPLYFGRRAYL